MRHNRKIIFLASFLFSIPVALTSYINSSFLEKFLDKDYVGFLYVIASIFTIWGLFKMPIIVEKIGNRLAAIVSSFLIFGSLILMATGRNIYVIAPAFILYFISFNFITANLDIFIEDFSKNSSIGTLRGLYLTIINSAWIVSQLISGSIVNISSFSGIYFFSAGMMFFVLCIFISSLHGFKDPEYKKVSFIKVMRIFLKNKHISKIYLINLIVKFFYAWMVIYTPIYLHENIGFDWSQIGIIFSIMLLPFVLLDYPLGKLSDKIGEKKALIISFVIIFLSVIVIPPLKTSSIWIWASVLFMTRIGAASIEVMSESYFFKSINKQESPDEISFFRNTLPVSYIIAPLLAVPILVYLPAFEYLFYILSAILLGGLLTTLKIRDIK